MKVLVFTQGSDTGGQGQRIASAFGRLTDWDVQSRAMHIHPFGYPGQVRIPPRERRDVIGRMYVEADVVHLRNDPQPWREFDRGQGKPIVMHFHGSDLRLHPGKAEFARRMGAQVVVSTLDMTLLGEDFRWLPSPYPVTDLRRQRTYLADGRVRIAYFPTSPKVKSLDAFMAAYARVAQGHDVQLLTNVRRGRIFHRPWREVMAQKAGADVLFDQVTLGYGNNAIEAWSLGIPVIAGAADPRVRALMLERFGRLPFHEATEDTIEDALVRMVESASMRDEYGQLGHDHALRFHAEEAVVPYLQELWQAAKPTRGVAGTWAGRLPEKAA